MSRLPPHQTYIVRSWAGVEALAPEWAELHQSSAAKSIFLGWDWIDTWHRALDGAVDPFVVTVRDHEGRLLGLGPFHRMPYRLLRAVPLQLLRTLGDSHTGSEYPDWIVLKGREAEVTRSIAATLRASRAWDALWMPSMATWTGAEERVATACGAFALGVRCRPADFGALSLPSSFGTFMSDMRSHARRGLKRINRIVFEEKGLQFSRCDRVEDLPAYLEFLFKLHQRRWQSVGIEGSFGRSAAKERFYRAFAELALRRGWLRFFALGEGDTLRALHFGLSWNGTFFGLQQGWDPGDRSGLGTALMLRMVECLIQERVSSLDLLGGYNEYKRRWRCERRVGCDLLAVRRSPLTWPIVAGKIWPTGRFLRPAPNTHQDARRPPM